MKRSEAKKLTVWRFFLKVGYKALPLNFYTKGDLVLEIYVCNKKYPQEITNNVKRKVNAVLAVQWDSLGVGDGSPS